MEITRVKIFPANEDHLKAYVNITIDDCFLITGLKLIRVSKGYYVEMPRAKRANGEYVDIAAPLNNETRQMIEEKVFAAYQQFADEPVDDCFVIHGLRLTHSEKGYFLFMPGTKRADGTYVDIAHPLDNETRQMIQEKVVAEYERVAGKQE